MAITDRHSVRQSIRVPCQAGAERRQIQRGKSSIVIRRGENLKVVASSERRADVVHGQRAAVGYPARRQDDLVVQRRAVVAVDFDQRHAVQRGRVAQRQSAGRAGVAGRNRAVDGDRAIDGAAARKSLRRAERKTTGNRRHIKHRAAGDGNVSRICNGTRTAQCERAGIDDGAAGVGVGAAQCQSADAILRQSAVRGDVAADGGMLQRLADGHVESGRVYFRADVADVDAADHAGRKERSAGSGGFQRAAVEIENPRRRAR